MFNNKTGDKKIDEAIEIAKGLFHKDSKMMKEIEAKKDFKYESGYGNWVHYQLTKPRPSIDVYFYKPWNRWTKALGYFDGKAIYINSRKFDYLSMNDLVGLLCHERAHQCGFSHGNNYKTEDKVKFSVPYFISEGISRWL